MTGKQVEGRWFQMTNRRLDMFVGKMERLDAERQDGWDGMEWNGMEWNAKMDCRKLPSEAMV